ncbi:hypothetical protein ZHAS_00006630 [Anopheles sinensis]|uniref:Uncharacterized protein n=1 Tax=Anopheles sinensis TaxID=74873 RepID=A0A084VMT4_ANOSI|nr:hypothetical protein ZHAS_00006630 [Anopheles sinensis]
MVGIPQRLKWVVIYEQIFFNLFHINGERTCPMVSSSTGHEASKEGTKNIPTKRMENPLLRMCVGKSSLLLIFEYSAHDPPRLGHPKTDFGHFFHRFITKVLCGGGYPVTMCLPAEVHFSRSLFLTPKKKKNELRLQARSTVTEVIKYANDCTTSTSVPNVPARWRRTKNGPIFPLAWTSSTANARRTLWWMS